MIQQTVLSHFRELDLFDETYLYADLSREIMPISHSNCDICIRTSLTKEHKLVSTAHM